MSFIYDMTGGKPQSPRLDNKTAAARDELHSVPALRELTSSDTEGQPRAVAVHLVRALLREG